MNKKKNILFIMPFGKKSDINFDNIYNDFKVCLSTDFNVHRVDTMVGNNVDEKMYKGIAAADVVIADLSLENANVFYELGVRHALRSSRTILISNSVDKIPYDINRIGVLEYTSPSDIIENIKLQITKKEKDSIVLKNLNIDDPVKFDKFANVFDNWEHKYETTIAEIERFKKCARNSKAEDSMYWIDGLKFINEHQKYFSEMFEPILTAKVLFTYKADNESKYSLLKALDLLKILTPEISTSYEVLGLYASIQNKLVQKTPDKEMAHKALYAAQRFLSSQLTNYSVGVSIMSYVEALNCELISRDYYNESIRLLMKSFAKIRDYNEEDIKWTKDTETLINYAIDDKYDISKITDPSTKQNISRIKEVVYKNI